MNKTEQTKLNEQNWTKEIEPTKRAGFFLVVKYLMNELLPFFGNNTKYIMH